MDESFLDDITHVKCEMYCEKPCRIGLFGCSCSSYTVMIKKKIIFRQVYKLYKRNIKQL